MKKIVALMLAVMMMALPTMSLAAETVNITMQHGSLAEMLMGPEMGAAVNQLIDMIGLSFYSQENGAAAQGGMALTLGGETAVDIDFAASENGEEVVVASNLLGANTVAVTMDELKAMGLEIPAQTENAELDMSDLDLTKIMELAAPIAERMVVEEVTEQLEGVDPAVTKMTMTMTIEEAMELGKVFLDEVMKTQYFQQLMQQMEAVGASMTVNMPESGDVTGVISMEMYMDEAGTPVYMNMFIDGTAKEDGKEEKITETIELSRLTEDGIVTYEYVVVAQGDDDSSLLADMNLAIAGENEAELSMTVGTVNGSDYEEMLNLYAAAYTEDGAAVCAVSFAVNDNGQTVGLGLLIVSTEDGDATHTTIEVLPLDSEDAYITIVVDTDKVEDKAALDAANALHVLTMEQEDLQAFVQQVSQNAMMQLITVMQKLPSELLSMIMQ